MLALLSDKGFTQTNSPSVADPNSYAPAVLPGKGLAQHPFLLTGEADSRNQEQTLFVVRDSKVAWTYSVPLKTTNGESELGDATMLSSGNIVFCRKVSASEVTPEKKIVWALSQWKDPDLGRAFSIQLLDEPGTPENPGDVQR